MCSNQCKQLNLKLFYFVQIIGNSVVIAQATGKVIAQAVVSAIYACCECNYSQIVQDSMWLHINQNIILKVATVSNQYSGTSLFECCAMQNKQTSHAS